MDAFPWKKLIFGEIEGLTILSVLSKNGYQIFLLPEITDVLSGRKWKNFETGSQKLYFWKACKKLLRNLNSRFSISSHTATVEVFEVLSGAMTSSPEVVRIQKFWMIFGVFRPTESDSLKVYGPALRLAELSSPYFVGFMFCRPGSRNLWTASNSNSALISWILR